MPTKTQILFTKTETIYSIFSNYKNAWLGNEMKVKRQPVVQSRPECAVVITIGKSSTSNISPCTIRKKKKPKAHGKTFKRTVRENIKRRNVKEEEKKEKLHIEQRIFKTTFDATSNQVNAHPTLHKCVTKKQIIEKQKKSQTTSGSRIN